MKKGRVYRSLTAIVVWLAASATAIAEETVDPPEQRSVVIMDTFFVHADAVGFYDMIGRAIKLSKEVDPSGGGQINILAGHPEPDSASQVIVFTTYPTMDAYIANKDALERDPKLQAIFQEMKDAGYQFLQRTMNSVVAQY